METVDMKVIKKDIVIIVQNVIVETISNLMNKYVYLLKFKSIF